MGRRSVTRPPSTTGTPRVVAYQRVSTHEQADSGLGLEAQTRSISQAATARGWEVVATHRDAGVSGKSMINRPALLEALEALREGTADILIVSKLDRLSRSLLDIASLLQRSAAEGWRVVALDTPELDTTTPAGEMLLHLLGAFSQFERRVIGQRTRDALAVRRAQGFKLGRPRSLSPETSARIVLERRQGRTLAAISEGLNRDEVPTAQGGVRWWPRTVSAVLAAIARDADSDPSEALVGRLRGNAAPSTRRRPTG